MTGDLRFDAMLPAWALALTALAAVAMVWRVARAAGGGAALLRALAAAGLLVILLGPSLASPTPDAPSRRTVTLLLDTSRSMVIRDHAEGESTRFEAARRWLDPALLEQVRRRAQVRAIAFDAQSREIEPALLRDAQATGEETRLAGALLLAVGSSAPGDLVVALTDGADSEGAPLDPAVDLATARGVSIAAAPVGSPDAPPDASVALRASRETISAGEAVELIAQVRSQRMPPGAARLRIVERAGDRSERVVLDRPVDLTQAGMIRTTAAPPATRPGGVGAVAYIATLDAGGDDAGDSNNEAVAGVQVSDAPLRVLVFEARPSWETRFFLDALRADSRVEVVSVAKIGERDRVLVSSSAGKASEPIERAPVEASALAAFDVVALGRGVERWFPGEGARAISRFATQRGGGVIFLRGDPIVGDGAPAQRAREILEAISPVAWGTEALEGGRLFATMEGRGEAPVAAAATAGGDPYLDSMPGARSTTLNEGERTLSAVWLRSDAPGADPTQRAPAAIAHMPVGRGGSLAVLTDGLWRWAFAPPDREDARRAYSAFWAQAIRTLAGGADLPAGAELSITTRPGGVEPGEPARIEVRARPGSLAASTLPIEVAAPDGSRRSLTARRAPGGEAWRATLTPDLPGLWRISARAQELDAQAEGMLIVRRDDAEATASGARPAALAALAEATGGRTLPIDAPDALLAWLDAAPAPAHANGDSGERLRPLWRRQWALALLAGLLLTEWIVRRARGGV